jgi:glycosyltransferase involved in cell wall biosynthesis
VGDNYELCFTNKYFEKEKIYIEVPTGIGLRWPPSEAPAGVERLSAPHWLLAPRGATRFYGADVILKAFQAYCEKGGTTFALILLQGAYPLDPTLSPTIYHLEKQYKNMFLFFRKRLDKKYMSYLWQHAAAFISAPVYDGYSYAVAEGRWHGALPIVNAIPAHREILTHGYNAWFVEPFTPEKLTEALFHIEALLQNSPPFWKERNRAWIARYSDLSTNAQLFLAIAEKALAGKHV